MARVVGIDLGTTYCAVAVADRAGTPSIVRNREGENITPSVVMFQGDTVVVGSQAKRSAATAPDHVVQFAKRYMGAGRREHGGGHARKRGRRAVSVRG
ncbi:Hsp70 family protein [Streptomyces tendae]|uniref:Hsp70 family protein n=1 Tax=Streptomyces tendae TaxID=1932 RepID=UPI0037174CD3